MPSIFNSLNIGYSGLSASQIGIDTTSHNIANAESEGYTRQRVVTAAATPISARPGQVGNGAEVLEIERIFDNYVFDRYTSVSGDKEYSDYETKTLNELSTYFPEIDGVGIKSDLRAYYDMWQTFADNPNNDSIKVALAQQTETLSSHIQQTQGQINTLQQQVNNELSVNIDEVNSLAKELASINRAIDTAEAGDVYTANDLRDKRNLIERDLSRLIGAKATSGQLESNIQVDSSSNLKTGSYTLSVNGFNIVDGATYHPLKLNNENNTYGYFSISYERQDGTLIPMEENITSGKIGAILDLRGGKIDPLTGKPEDGIIQKSLDQMDAFAKGLVESTNNIYAQTSTTKMESNLLDLNPTNSLVSSPLNVNEGSFELIVYDVDGKEAGKRVISIDAATSMTGIVGSNSIQGQIEATVDDNADSNANNDIDDYITFNWATYAEGNGLELEMDPLAKSRGYTFAIRDILPDDSFSSGTNFAGALGMNRYLDGDNASSIGLNLKYADNPTLMSAGATSLAGDSNVALDMVQHQFEEYTFQTGNIDYTTTTYGMFDIIATEVGTATNSAILRNETVTTQFNATELEYASVSKVSIDEEMTNLIKYQTSYGAAAKIITTIDQMMQTLLGIKQ